MLPSYFLLSLLSSSLLILFSHFLTYFLLHLTKTDSLPSPRTPFFSIQPIYQCLALLWSFFFFFFSGDSRTRESGEVGGGTEKKKG